MSELFTGFTVLFAILCEIAIVGICIERILEKHWKFNFGIFMASFITQVVVFLFVLGCWHLGHMIRVLE